MKSQAATAAPIQDGKGAEGSNRVQKLEEALGVLDHAASIIRKEEQHIIGLGFADSGLRLLRLLAETVDEQRVAFSGGKSK